MSNEEKITELEEQIEALTAAIKAPTPGTWVNVGVLGALREKLEAELNELKKLTPFNYIITSKHTQIRLYIAQVCGDRYTLVHRFLEVFNGWCENVIDDPGFLSRKFSPEELEKYIFDKFHEEVTVKELEDEY